MFAAHDAIIDHNVQWVEENPAGFLESDAVLALVGEVFRLVPLEPYFVHVNIVIILLQLCKKAGGEASAW